MGFGESHPSLTVSLDRIIKDVVDLDHAIVWKDAVHPGNVTEHISRPANITSTRPILEGPIGRAVTLILLWPVVYGIMRT